MKAYKQLYTEAQEEIARLRTEVTRLQALVNLHPDEATRELERIRVVVDLAGIAAHMRVERYTPQQWRQRGHLPPVDFPHIKEPLWYASTIRDRFAVPTKRIWYAERIEPEEDTEELSSVA